MTKICMLDIETFDTAPTARILSLGAVDVYGSATFYEEFGAYQYGRTVSQATIDWWKSQTIIPSGTVDLEEGLKKFHAWYTEQGFTEVWCKGSDFDFVILSDAYKSIPADGSVTTSIGTPWKYNHVRDLRTLIKIFPEVKAPANYVVHHALLDAVCQSLHLKALLNHVNGQNS